jgi:hypothetical protein
MSAASAGFSTSMALSYRSAGRVGGPEALINRQAEIKNDKVALVFPPTSTLFIFMTSVANRLLLPSAHQTMVSMELAIHSVSRAPRAAQAIVSGPTLSGVYQNSQTHRDIRFNL